MGKVEKFVVLTVLFLVALILGVTLNTPKGVAEAAGTHVAGAEPTRAPMEARAEPRESLRQAPMSRSSRGEPSASDASRAELEGASEAATRSARKAADSIDRSASLSGNETDAGNGVGANRGLGTTHLAEQSRHTSGGGAAANPQRSQPAPSGQAAGPAGVLSTSRPVVERSGQESSTRDSGLLNGAQAPVQTRDADNGNGFILTLTDLAPSLSDEFMIYTWKEGDTFAKVSERYFGSRMDVNRLLRNNEGLEDSNLNSGDKILVPVRAPAEVSVTGNGATTYTVKSGDVLGGISTTVYGTSKNWRKIYDANRDQLADPNRLVVGMVLRIPE